MVGLALDFDLSLEADQEAMLDEVRRFSTTELEGLRGEDDPGVETAELRIKQLGLDDLTEYPPLLAALVTEELARGSLRLAVKVAGTLFARKCLSDAPDSIRIRMGDVSAGPGLVCGRSVRGIQGDPSLKGRVLLAVPDSRTETWLLGAWTHDRTEPEFWRLSSEVELAWAENTYRMHVILWASLIVGAMRRGLEAAHDHARTRRSFGKPLVQHQAVAIRLADMCLALDGCKLLAWRFASFPDDGAIRPSDAADGISEAAVRFASDMVQMFGAHGYVSGGTANRIFKDLHAAARQLCA